VGLAFCRDRPEKAKATPAIREALARLDRSADLGEMRVAAREALRPFCQAIERRQLDARLVSWALQQLPWGRTDRDEASLRRECAAILADLSLDLSQVEATAALEPTVAKARQQIEQRQSEQRRQAKKQSLIQAGLGEPTCKPRRDPGIWSTSTEPLAITSRKAYVTPCHVQSRSSQVEGFRQDSRSDTGREKRCCSGQPRFDDAGWRHGFHCRTP
jgi:hypothetical protein